MSEEQLRQRIQWCLDALTVCQENMEQRESLILRLLDTQDQLMFLKLQPTRPPLRLRAV